MLGQHELAELAPRDIVAKAITRRMQEQGAAHMYLDGRHFGAPMWEHRFPTILAACRAHGIDPVTEPIPVGPAAHYASGGIRTDLHGRTTVPGLYACGEAACTGVHGANRLASNSLLEGLVFAERIAEEITSADRSATAAPTETEPTETAPTEPTEPTEPTTVLPLIAPEARHGIQRTMSQGAGVLRSARSLQDAADQLEAVQLDAGEEWAGPAKSAEPGVDSWETTNLLCVSRVLVAAALEREETRGCHWREDRPDRDDTDWQRHLVVRLTPDRRLVVRRTPTAAFPPVALPPV
jgi:L-aspartate oxidase